MNKPAQRKKQADFVKKTQRVGKKKLAPTNATSTRFKTRSVALPEQSQFASTEADSAPASHRKLAAAGLLAQLTHYSADVRCDALKGLAEVLGRHPEALPPIAPTVLQRALLLCEDEYARVRKAALGVLRVSLPYLEQVGALGPHEQSLRLRLQSAMSHPERLVRLDALPLLQLLLQLRPSALVPPPPLLLPALCDMLSGGAPSGDAAAKTALDAASATLQATSALLSAQLVAATRKSSSRLSAHGRGVDPSGGDDGDHGDETTPRVLPTLPGFGYAHWRAAPEPASAVVSGVASADKSGTAWLHQLHQLPTLVVRSWVESAVSVPRALSTQEHAATLECGLAVVALCKQLLCCDALLGARTADGEAGETSPGAIASLLAPPLLKHVAPHMPLSRGAGAVAGSKRRRGGESGGGITVGHLDAALCEVLCMLLAALPPALLPDAAKGAAIPGGAPSQVGGACLPSVDVLAALCRRLSGHLCENLAASTQAASGANDEGGAPSAVTHETTVMLHGARLLLASGWMYEARAAGVPRALVDVWEHVSPAAPIRPALLAVLSAILTPMAKRVASGGMAATLACVEHRRSAVVAVAGPAGWAGAVDLAAIDEAYTQAIDATATSADASDDHGHVALDGETAALRERYLRSLPKLLWQLQNGHPNLSLALLQTLLALAKLADTASSLIQPLQAMLEPYFCATRRRAQPQAAPLIGPFAAAAPTVRRAACHLLQRLQPMSDSMLEALAACACLAPASAGELSSVVDAAERSGALDGSAALSFATTLALDAAAAIPASTAGDPDAETLWRVGVTALVQRSSRGGKEATLDALRRMRSGDVRDGVVEALMAAVGAA